VSTLLPPALILLSGTAAGLINSVAGGGTLVSFPTLLWLGRDPIVANATNALALWPGSFAGAYGFRRELGAARPLLVALLPSAILGSALGGWLLLRTSSATFAFIVPYLLLLATALLAAGRLVARLLPADAHDAPPSPARATALAAAQLLVSIYGGYFGAGMGILMLAALGLYGIHDIHRRNGLKNVLGAAINGVAGIYFVASGAIAWADAGLLAAGAIVGGLTGAAIGRRLPKRVVEAIVVTMGVAATAHAFFSR
jgi:hypothetical protein